ncbi:hypothetical protein Poli38472_002380 [Pythium oligandrum]|uniref:Glutathione S-transferase n=1 Tax=Pythium oligandrum TaxID=41045 RepID=A0A8K1CI16_PYTOL|nr:hypothetical protein Poli38472_002380 [Pythium oligandrum]|eukprot:TMW63439.1 hypothetical protein Poli38472_002380 [Pythium oligandrum]
MSQPQLKVTYFEGIPGRAELTRLALVYGGLKFENELLSFPEWAERKPSMPLGKLPACEVDGKLYIQSMAIARYAGRLTGTYPAEPLEALKVDMILETLVEAMEKWIEVNFYTKDETLKAEKIKAAETEFFPKIFSFIEKSIEGKFLLGEQVTLADLSMLDLYTNALPLFPGFLMSSYPKVAAILEALKANPNIAAHLA